MGVVDNGVVQADPDRDEPPTQTSKRVPEAEPKGYITDPVGTAAQRSHIVACLDGVEFGGHIPVHAGPRFFAHVLHSASAEQNDRWVPVGCRLIAKVFGIHVTEDVWRPLVKAGLMKFVGYNSGGGLSREFRVVDSVYEEHLALGLDRPGERRVYLSTGKTVRGQRRKVHKSYPNGKKPLPTLIYDAKRILAANGCPYDGDAAREHVRALNDDYEAAAAGWIGAGRPEAGDLHDAFVKARGRYQHDARCLTLMDGGAVKQTRVRRYRPALDRKPQMSGRITEVGGIQNASRAMKHAALASLRQSHDVRNYDFEASQPWHLVQEFEDHDVDATWLLAYLGGDKRDAAEKALGSRDVVQVDLWKRCVMGLVMGAALKRWIDEKLPRRPGQTVGSMPAITEHILYVYPNPDEAQRALDGIYAALLPLKDDLALWYRRMASEVKSGRYRVGGRGGNFVTNSCGVTLNTMLLSGWELTSALSAFFLQGREAALVHHLTCLGEAYGYEPLSNQHDGLIVRGEIPDAAVEEAKTLAGARYARLIEKPYHADLIVPGLND